MQKKKRKGKKIRETIFSGEETKEKQVLNGKLHLDLKIFQKSEIIGYKFLSIRKPNFRKPDVK